MVFYTLALKGHCGSVCVVGGSWKTRSRGSGRVSGVWGLWEREELRRKGVKEAALTEAEEP